MAKTTDIYSVKKVNNLEFKFDNSTSVSTPTTVWTAGADDGILRSFGLTSTNSSDILVQVFRNIPSPGLGADILLGTIKVVANSGNDGVTPAVDVFRSVLLPYLSIDAQGNPVLFSSGTTIIKAMPLTAPGSGHYIYGVGDGGDY